MSLFSRRPRGRMAVYACSLVALLTAQHAQASSPDAWEEFQQDVEKACLAAAGGVMQVKNIQLDPYGSESYGFAVLSGVENGSSTERLVACAYGKRSKVAEISSLFDGRLDGTAIEPTEAAVVVEDLPIMPASHGDVHIMTPDGLRFDFQATGDFFLSQSTDGNIVVQARQEAWDENPKVSINTAVAFYVDGVRIEYYTRPTAKLYIDGVETDRPTGDIELSNGVTMFLDPSSRSIMDLTIVWPNGLGARIVHDQNGSLDLGIAKVSPGSYVLAGLLGNLDGDPANDMQMRGGDVVPFTGLATEIDAFGESWRVPVSETQFLSGPRPASETPAGETPLTLDSLDPAAREASLAKCAAAGIADETALSNCTYDVAATGDETFIQSAQVAQTAITAIEQAALASPDGTRASRALKDGGFVQRTVTPAAAKAPEPEVQAAAPEAPAVDVPPPSDLPRGERLTQNGHYLVFQEDGNLCVYREADNGWVWCINNDPGIDYAKTARVRTTQAGQLIGEDADGVVLYALPAETPYTPAGVRISTEGVLEVYSADAVLWTSRD